MFAKMGLFGLVGASHAGFRANTKYGKRVVLFKKYNIEKGQLLVKLLVTTSIFYNIDVCMQNAFRLRIAP